MGEGTVKCCRWGKLQSKRWNETTPRGGKKKRLTQWV